MVQYYLYSSKEKRKLDLSKCKNTKINIYVPANIIEKEIFKYNRSSDYYNDVCFSYTTENETDIAIADRKKEYNKNKMSVCEVNCDFTEYNSITKKAKCECNINDEMPTIQEVIENKKDLIFSFLDIKNATNFLIMKCFHKLFTSEGLKKNIGSYIILMIIIIAIASIIIFILRDYKILLYMIDEILSQKHNIKQKTNITKNNESNVKVVDDITENNVKENTLNINQKKLNNTIKQESNTKTQINKNVIKILKEKSIITSNEEKGGQLSSNLEINTNKNLFNDDNNILSKNLVNNDYELNSLSYNEALKIDKRTYLQYYFSLLKRKQII